MNYSHRYLRGLYIVLVPITPNHRCREQHAGQPWGAAAVFEKAYLIQLLDEMLKQGVTMEHVDTPGGYIEIDTQQDFQYAREQWIENHLRR